MTVKLEWITPEADRRIGYMARVSNPKALPDAPVAKLITYLIEHRHWSPFEMANACVAIETTRDIARQILRHRSFHFQEFSQRYSEVDDKPMYADLRTQDYKNRQNSLSVKDDEYGQEFKTRWSQIQESVWEESHKQYRAALDLGVAKELARKLLPEGLTKTKMYMSGTIRDWLHYLAIRTGPETQYEHRVVANEILWILEEQCPLVFEAAKKAGVIK